ncbi:uncharacterized protein H6S33_005365 [Morchella sextelata]|uniref:uncharacterized protein n=1 Tax=Morchella sextelata TaxID=1174677 RepID=UPI001D0480A2|nr:uncharacterized protein H6S33_005365 [Morchella sextelata]KAH0613479.1 hypothetical protein H6S33_005365 [Morchella sextelata]
MSMSARLLFTRGLIKPHISVQLPRHTTTTSRMSTAAKTPAVPRLSASLLLLNPRNEILLIHRPTHSSTFPNAHVFPGGATSPDDSASADPLKHCAIRETFEETGLLLTHPPPPPSLIPGIPAARSQIHSGALSFAAYLKANNLTPAVDDLIPFTKWITPESMPRRFETHMFLYLLPADHASTAAAQRPTSDGGIETLSARFITPHSALAAAARNELVLFPPQFYLLSSLLPYLPGGAEEEAGLEDHVAKVRRRRRRLLRFARGDFGAMVMEPAPLRRLGDGRVVMGLGPRGDQERAVVIQVAERGEPRGLEMVGRGEVARL